MNFHVRNMVSSRCIHKVKSELQNLGMAHENVQLGMVELSKTASDVQMVQLRDALSLSGLEVMLNKNEVLVERIKAVVRQMLDEPLYDAVDQVITNSEYISNKLGKNYTFLAHVFAEKTGISIGQYIINHRIEHTKVLIQQNILTLSEIAFRLNYSSIGHLSNQFRQITGMSPSEYRRISRNGLRTSRANGSLKGQLVPHILSAESTEARFIRNFTSTQISINKI